MEIVIYIVVMSIFLFLNYRLVMSSLRNIIKLTITMLIDTVKFCDDLANKQKNAIKEDIKKEFCERLMSSLKKIDS